MASRKKRLNTRFGGHALSLKLRLITANPKGSREERRAADRLARRQRRDEKKS